MKLNKKIWLAEHDIVQNGEGWIKVKIHETFVTLE